MLREFDRFGVAILLEKDVPSLQGRSNRSFGLEHEFLYEQIKWPRETGRRRFAEYLLGSARAEELRFDLLC